MREKFLTGSKMFYNNQNDIDYLIITDENIVWQDIKEKGIDNFIYYTNKENTLDRIFFTIMTLLLHGKTNHPVYIKERPKLKEALENEFKIKFDRHLSKLAWWYLLAIQELEGTFNNLTNEYIKDLVERNRARNLTEEEKQILINFNNIQKEIK